TRRVATQRPARTPATTVVSAITYWLTSTSWCQRIESAARTRQKAPTTPVSGREALIAAITGGIASSPIRTTLEPTSPSRTATTLATTIAIEAGPESSCRLA